MKQFLIAAALVLAGSFAHAQTNSSMNFELPLTQGHAQIGGGFAFTNLGGDYSQLYFGPRAEYFIMNNISLGGEVDLSFGKSGPGTSFDEQFITLAPSGTFYFWQGAGMATYINQRVSITFPKGGSSFIGGQTGLGIGFFLNQHVSIAPEIQAAYADKSRGSLNLMAMISAYL